MIFIFCLFNIVDIDTYYLKETRLPQDIACAGIDISRTILISSYFNFYDLQCVMGVFMKTSSHVFFLSVITLICAVDLQYTIFMINYLPFIKLYMKLGLGMDV